MTKEEDGFPINNVGNDQRGRFLPKTSRNNEVKTDSCPKKTTWGG
jgi:hypothetical protein